MLNRRCLDGIDFTDREIAEIEDIYLKTTYGLTTSCGELFEEIKRLTEMKNAEEPNIYIHIESITKVWLHGYLKGIREERENKKEKYQSGTIVCE